MPKAGPWSTRCAHSQRAFMVISGVRSSRPYTLPYLFFLVMLRRPWCAYCFPVVCFHSQMLSAPEAGAPVAASPLGGALAFGISLGMQGLHPPWVLILKRGLERRRQRRGRVLGERRQGRGVSAGRPQRGRRAGAAAFATAAAAVLPLMLFAADVAANAAGGGFTPRPFRADVLWLRRRMEPALRSGQAAHRSSWLVWDSR